MPLQKFGRGMKHNVRTVFKRTNQIRRGQRRIEHQRHARFVRDVRNLLNIDQQIPRISQRLAEAEPRVRTHGRAPGIDVTRIDERRFNAKSRQRVIEQIV